jgi:LAO/AO transport system kinase
VLLLVLAGAGDELSSMKRGLLEAADVIAFNKADGGRAGVVENEAATLRASLGISRGDHSPPVLVISSHEGTGVAALWQVLGEQHAAAEHTGALSARRAEQRKAWFDAALEAALREVFMRRPDLLPLRAAA